VKDLIFSQICADAKTTASLSQGSLHAGRLLHVSLTLVCRLNPDADVLLIDNASTLPLEPYLPDGPWIVNEMEAGPVPRIHGKRTVLRFKDALGHFHYNKNADPPPRDGPGRAIMTGLQAAIDGCYDRCMYIEGDAVTSRPAEHFFAHMDKPVASPKRTPHGYLDWNLFFIKDVDWLRRFDFIGKYAWQHRHRGEPPGEEIYEVIFGKSLQVMNLSGGRGDPMLLNGWQGHTTIKDAFPNGCDYFTHGRKEDFEMFLEVNGHSDLKALL
jgi:hypothetical protein